MGRGKLNARTQADPVRLMPIDGREYLFYKALPIHVGIIRGTTADPDGNITMEREALTLEAQAIAMAAHNCGGIVIAQVERPAERGTPAARGEDSGGDGRRRGGGRKARIPHADIFHAIQRGLRGELRVPLSSIGSMPLNARKIIARRAAMELRNNDVVNTGIGMPEGIANVAAEEQIIDLLTLTAEPGVIGGIPASGLNFGAATNPQAVIDQPSQFDFYDGGGLDVAFSARRRRTRKATSTSVASATARLGRAASSISRRTRARSSLSAPSPPTSSSSPSQTAS